MIVYVFLIKRDQDRVAWPCVYDNLELAEKAFGRSSPVVSVTIPSGESFPVPCYCLDLGGPVKPECPICKGTGTLGNENARKS